MGADEFVVDDLKQIVELVNTASGYELQINGKQIMREKDGLYSAYVRLQAALTKIQEQQNENH